MVWRGVEVTKENKEVTMMFKKKNRVEEVQIIRFPLAIFWERAFLFLI